MCRMAKKKKKEGKEKKKKPNSTSHMKTHVEIRLCKVFYKKSYQISFMSLPRRLYSKESCVMQPEKSVIIFFNYS